MNHYISVKTILNNANQYYFSDWEKYIAQDRDEYYIILPYMNAGFGTDKVLSVYYIHEMLELGNCFLGHNNEQFVLWHICKSIPTECRVSIFRGYAHPYRDKEMFENYVLKIPDVFSQEFNTYVSFLDTWRSSGIKPLEGKGPFEFIQLSFHEFDRTKPVARYYSKRFDKTRELLSHDTLVPLRDIASFVQCHIVDCEPDTGLIRAIDGNKFPSYPFSPERDSIDYIKTNYILHKGDILCRRNRDGLSFFLIDKEPSFDLYAPPASTVIHAQGVSPEYLYLYLSSDTAKRIESATTIRTSDNSFITLTNDIKGFPVILPQKDDSVYQEEFARLASPDSRYYTAVSEQISRPKTMEEELVKELIKRLNQNNASLLKKQLEEDLQEMDVCFEGGAYKASLILAGSILEAVLIDWLSEIKGHDYFQEDLMKRVYDKKLGCYKTDGNGDFIYHTNRKADLSDYIDEIKDLKKPKWIRESQEADEIRKKRNLVHAKLCLKENVQINESLCRSVRDYLLDVIASRLAHNKSE